MLPYEINGLPLHILLVHFVVIVVPAGALMTALGALWPAFRRKVGVLTPIVTLLGLLSVPLATNAGEWLEARVGSTPLLQQHVALGDTLLPWAVGQFVLALVIWAWYRFFAARRTVPEGPEPRLTSNRVPVGAGAGAAGGTSLSASTLSASTLSATAPSPAAENARPERRRAGLVASLVVSIVLIVLGVGVSAGTIAKVVQIGESGSSAVWQGSFSDEPTSAN